MLSTPTVPLPTSPDALRDLVLSLLQKQAEQEAEWAERLQQNETFQHDLTQKYE